MNLPNKYIENMKELFASDFESYMESFDDKPRYGLRINTAKIGIEDFLKICPFELSPIPWTKDGFYYSDEAAPTKHPYFYAGLYYIQEPSAMAPVNYLQPDKGDVVLDLCAAPGGKTLQLSNLVGESGVVISNDISASRLKAVTKNIERFGTKNVIVVCEDVIKIKKNNAMKFDAILVDAPCSGEGMFRKEPKLINHWEEDINFKYNEIQTHLLDEVSSMLKPGGKLGYSTCTFSMIENEQVIDKFISEHEGFELIDFDKSLISRGFKISSSGINLDYTGRILPFVSKGEGHFIAVINKKHEEFQVKSKNPRRIPIPKEFEDFCMDALYEIPEGNYLMIGDKLYIEPEHEIDLKGLRVQRSGWYLGEVKKNRFEPSGAFAMGLKSNDAKYVIDFDIDDINVIKYLKGETLNVVGQKGWNLVCVDGYPLGWAKVAGGVVKNKYPVSWKMV